MRLFFLISFLLGAMTPVGFAMQAVNICMVENLPGHQVTRYVMEEVYQQAGITVSFSPLPNKRSLAHANSGICDGELARIAKATKVFSNLRAVPTSLRNIQAFAFKKKGNNVSVKSWEDLAGLDIAIVRGEIYAASATKDYGPRVVKDYPTLFRMLHSEGVDVVVGLKVSAIHSLSQDSKRDEITRFSAPLYEEPIFHLLHKDRQKVADKINLILDEMQKNGRLEQLTNEAVAKLAAGKF